MEGGITTRIRRFLMDSVRALRNKPTNRTAHEVEKGSNLDLLLRGTIGAVNKLADSIGGGLRAVALALSTPQDNSAEVQKQIDKFTQEIKSSTDALDGVVKANQPSTK